MDAQVLISTDDLESFGSLLSNGNNGAVKINAARDFTDAILHALDHDVDIIFLDIDDRNSTGAKALEIMKKIRPKLPVVIVSSDDVHLQTGAAIKELGAFYHLVKPLDGDTVKNVLKSALEAKNGDGQSAIKTAQTNPC